MLHFMISLSADTMKLSIENKKRIASKTELSGAVILLPTKEANFLTFQKRSGFSSSPSATRLRNPTMRKKRIKNRSQRLTILF